MKNCLVVLGMHRSGTSAFTGILDLLGVHLGSRMLETQPDNPKGFFENKYVVLANDCILETLNTSWDDTYPLPADWQDRFQHSQLLEDIRNFLRTDLAENQLSALKDPRLSRLLPLWLPLFATAGVSPHFALIIRNPLEIAESLAHRNGFSTEKSLLLWMQYMMGAERNTRHLPRGFVNFESLLGDPRGSVEKVFRNAGLATPTFSEEHAEELSQFLDRRLRHYKATDAELATRGFRIVADYYHLLCKISSQETATAQDLQGLDELCGQFESNQSLFYNNDLLRAKALDEDRHKPDWYEAKLKRIKEQFETDKLYREYRYIANTEYLYKERPQLHAHVDRLEHEIKQFIGSPPWRVYKKYQETIEKLLPEGTALRRQLQNLKKVLHSTAIRNTGLPGEGSGGKPELSPRPGSETIASSEQTPKQAGDVSAEQPTWESLTFTYSEKPSVSIIIPVFNNWMFTYKCLRSVYEYTTGDYEIIVVDNHSTDLTPQLLASMRGIRVITNATNEVFVNACNQAAKCAKGDYLLLLNNDTEVTAGWLEALSAPFADARTGIVGAKLIYPDGTLQEAGGIIWRDGTGCNYGHGDNPDLPQYSYRRAVDYCSGACLMLSRKLWEEIGGFDQRYAPAYYEDTDLCFTVRALNYKVIFQPAARVVHYGGASAGKETSSGYKRFQEINRHKFVQKWQEVLERDHVLSTDGLFKAREKNGDKRILIIDHNVPTFDRDSGSLRMLSMLQILQDMGYKVSFWPDDLAFDAKYTKTLQDLGIETYYGNLSFEDFIAQHGSELDAVLMSRPATAKKYLHLVKKYSAAQTIFDTVDLHFVREQRRLELEVQQWKNLEFFLAEETDNTLVVSPTEKEILAGENFADKVAVVSNIHSLEPCEKGFEDRYGLMFIGGFAHPPNEEGIVWFIEFILPLIRRKLPNVHLTIVGSDPTERLKAMATDAITVTGYVADVSRYFNDSRVFVSPLLHGAGVKGKIGQSFSYGLPVVTTSIGAEGMQLTDGHNALISDSETEFADKVVALYTDKFLWQKLSTNCRLVIREQFSADTIRAALEKVLWKSPSLGRSISCGPRPVIVHCHMFKNAGSTLDWSLKRHFGTRFIQHWDDANMRQGASYLGPYIESHAELAAISSHHVQFPLPVAEAFQILPIIALRHPIDRARSVYEFERRQESDTSGAVQAKKLSFTEYVRWRMQPDVGPTIRNFHCCFCTGHFAGEVGEQQYLDSVALLTKMPLLVIVERYDESMLLLENQLARYFPRIDLSYIRQNATPGREDNLERRVDAVFAELGPELSLEFREKNHWDMKLYEDAHAILNERLGSLGRIDTLLEEFRARCGLLAAGSLTE
jgi:GT2 family glycosyltransferase